MWKPSRQPLISTMMVWVCFLVAFCWDWSPLALMPMGTASTAAGF